MKLKLRLQINVDLDALVPDTGIEGLTIPTEILNMANQKLNASLGGALKMLMMPFRSITGITANVSQSSVNLFVVE